MLTAADWMWGEAEELSAALEQVFYWNDDAGALHSVLVISSEEGEWYFDEDPESDAPEEDLDLAQNTISRVEVDAFLECPHGLDIFYFGEDGEGVEE